MSVTTLVFLQGQCYSSWTLKYLEATDSQSKKGNMPDIFVVKVRTSGSFFFMVRLGFFQAYLANIHSTIIDINNVLGIVCVFQKIRHEGQGLITVFKEHIVHQRR